MKMPDHYSRYISILSNRMRRHIDAMAAQGSYSGTEGKALNFLLANMDRDLFQRDIEQEFGLRPPSASAIVRRMEEDGLITREAVSYDGRLKKIILTQKAMQSRDEVMGGLQTMEDKLLKDIDKEELQVWLRVTNQMIRNL